MKCPCCGGRLTATSSHVSADWHKVIRCDSCQLDFYRSGRKLILMDDALIVTRQK